MKDNDCASGGWGYALREIDGGGSLFFQRLRGISFSAAFFVKLPRLILRLEGSISSFEIGMNLSEREVEA